jgi:3-isopropylmalate/(R)-2-methylmalate dehydratase small subunit
MAGWQTHDGMAAVLPRANIDTDQLIPARFMSVPRSEGYGDFLLHDMRRDASGALRADFPLNREVQASVLIAGANFGSGSSREAAVYALVDAGYRAIFAPSFGDIFASNAVNNGLLPARIEVEVYDTLVTAIGASLCNVHIDLSNGHAMFNDKRVDFHLDDTWRMKLLNGWDDIDLTQHHAAEIAQFQRNYDQAARWAIPAGAD